MSGVFDAVVRCSLGVIERPRARLGVLGRHSALLDTSLGSPGAPQNVDNELGSSSGASAAGNAIKNQWFFNDFEYLPELSKVVLWSLWGCLGASSGSWGILGERRGTSLEAA